MAAVTAIKMAAVAAILTIFKPHLLPNPKSDWAQTWWEVLGPHGGLELLKLFRSYVQDGCHLEIVQRTSPEL